jgi:hypothetical protein
MMVELEALLARGHKARDIGRGVSPMERRFQAFLERLRSVPVLDPACGSGNFLYIALQSLKDLEREVLLWGSMTLKLPIGFPRVGPYVWLKNGRRLLGSWLPALGFACIAALVVVILTSGRPLPNLFIYVFPIVTLFLLFIAKAAWSRLGPSGVLRTLPVKVLTLIAVFVVFSATNGYVIGMLQRLDPGDVTSHDVVD